MANAKSTTRWCTEDEVLEWLTNRCECDSDQRIDEWEPCPSCSALHTIQALRKELDAFKDMRLDDPIDFDLLTLRAASTLRDEGVRTYRDLTRKSQRDLLTQRNFGRKTLKVVQDLLRARGLSLRDEKADPDALDTRAELLSTIDALRRELDAARARDPKPSRGSGKPGRKQWEYLTVQETYFFDRDTPGDEPGEEWIARRLSELGEEGWEAFSLEKAGRRCELSIGHGPWTAWVYGEFKRERIDE
jgi:hypothetical protein